MLLTLDSSLHKPLYVQIRDQIKERILAGALETGARLDPSRELARRLGVHRTTVGNAYAELEAEGLIEGTVGRGTFVSALASTLRSPGTLRRRTNGDAFWNSFFAQEVPDDSLGRLMASAFEPGTISFATTHGSDQLCPADLVRRATDAVLRREGNNLLQYGSSEGYPPLKNWLERRLRRDGIAVGPEEILICNGCQQALDLIRRALVQAGDVVVCENPTYTGLWQVFESSGVRLMGVPISEHGMDLDFLGAILEQNRVKLILTSPNFQNPTGRTMPLGHRQRLLEMAARFQAPIIEDDVYGLLRFQGRDLPPLKSLDKSGLVIYLNSFSKIGFPGLRVGWVVASRRVIERLRWAKQRADLHTNLMAQAVLEEFGRRGWFEKIVRRSRKVYAAKLEVLRSAAQKYFPAGVRCIYPEGGMSVWVELPKGMDAAEVLVKTRDRGVVFAPSKYFYFQHPVHSALRLCYGGLSEQQISKGIQVLGEVFAAETRKPGKRPSRTAATVALV